MSTGTGVIIESIVTRGQKDKQTQRLMSCDCDIVRLPVDVDALAARLRTARRVTALTGAGVSAASGVPTFRGPGGLWRTFRSETLATPSAFASNPRLVWE